MTIGEISKKYNVDRRTIDYWTNVGILTPTTTLYGKGDKMECRDYGESNEVRLKIALFCKCAGMSTDDTLTWVKVIMYDGQMMRNESLKEFFKKMIQEQRDKAVRDYDAALEYVDSIL